jgi:hypothetical protein
MTARHRRWTLLVAGLVVVVVLAPVLVLVGRGDDAELDGEVPELVDQASLGEAGRELVRLVDEGRALVHHARYEQSDGSRAEVWVDGDRVREDVVSGDGARRRAVRTGDQGFTCTDGGDGWVCTDAGEVTTGIEDRRDQLVADLAGAGVTVRPDTIADHDVRCFSVTSAEGDVEVCLTLDGATARIAVADEQVELVELDRSVPDDAFDRPD